MFYTRDRATTRGHTTSASPLSHDWAVWDKDDAGGDASQWDLAEAGPAGSGGGTGPVGSSGGMGSAGFDGGAGKT